MAKVFLETSALVEAVFGNREAVAKIRSCIPEDAEIVTSRYVIFELAKGYLRYLVLLHRKALELSKFSELMGYALAIRYQPHFQGSVLGAFKTFFEQDSIPPTDTELLNIFRSFLRQQIRRGWREIEILCPKVINKAGCREDLAGPVLSKDGYELELKTNQCGKKENCGIKKFAAKNRELLARVRDDLQALEVKDAETTKRIQSLRELYRNPKDDFEASDCWRSGDALITVESPDDSCLLTKNKKHIEPVANRVGRNCTFY